MANPTSVINRISTKDELNINKNRSNNFESLNTSFDDAYKWDTETGRYINEDIKHSRQNFKPLQDLSEFKHITPNETEKSIATVRERSLFNTQNMFKKSIRFSLKAFLAAISLTLLNMFI